MGFINAVFELGKLESEKAKTRGGGADAIDDYLQLPMPIIEDEARSGKVIRVWLKVEPDKSANDPETKELNVSGISRMDLVDYWAGGGDVDEKKRRYLYRDPVGNNITWSFSPLYKQLYKPTKDGNKKKLLGKNDKWELDKKCHFYKIKKSVLSDYEKTGCFSKDSTDRIMKDLEKQIGRLSELWADKKRSYLLLFGIDQGGSFLYPGEVPAFRYYFSSKLEKSLSGGGASGSCALCRCSGTMLNLDKIFKFATFDKVSFLPGASCCDGAKGKVFPVCGDCLPALSRGREVLDSSFLDGKTIPGLKIYVVPELLLGQEGLKMVSEKTRDFIKTGIGIEEHVFRRLSRLDNSVVFHFLFWEKNKAQERLNLMVEDIPPSRLKKLENLWVECYRAHLWNDYGNSDFDENNVTLDQAIRYIYGVLSSLAGKSKGERVVMKGFTLNILGRLLGGNRVEVREVKRLMVSRFSGLFADPKWILSGGWELKKMVAVLDFLTRNNARGQ